MITLLSFKFLIFNHPSLARSPAWQPPCLACHRPLVYKNKISMMRLRFARLVCRAFSTRAAPSSQATFYNQKGEWLRECQVDGQRAFLIGITADSVEKVGELTYIDWPELGAEVPEDDPILEFDTSKASFGIDAPLDCTVLEVNKAIEEDDYALLQQSPETDGWFVKISAAQALQELPGLMDEAAYKTYLVKLSEDA